MVKLDIFFQFVRRQISQVMNGGPMVFYVKTKKMLHLFFMNICAPLVVNLEID